MPKLKGSSGWIYMKQKHVWMVITGFMILSLLTIFPHDSFEPQDPISTKDNRVRAPIGDKDLGQIIQANTQTKMGSTLFQNS